VAVLALVALGLAAAGCGEEEGVAAGATVTAYVEAPLCEGAGGGAANVRFVCLDDPRADGGLDLAAVGANARRASEDSAAVAFLEAPDPPLNKFTHPILESAGIAWITAASGARARQQLLGALGDADSGALRSQVRESLDQR
jgi:hypothetical protein